MKTMEKNRKKTNKQIAAFSGGKDSTAMILRLIELGEPVNELFYTRTGNELPEVEAHIDRIACIVKRPVIRPGNLTLVQSIHLNKAIPNYRMRFCTRQVKIEPCYAYMKKHPGATLYVGLRADEEDREGAQYGETVTERYPMREWGWTEGDVWDYLNDREITIPRRTDCAWCYHQRLGEWHHLWKKHPSIFAQGAELEKQYGHTFRSPQRDNWPAALADLGAEFEKGRIPKGGDDGQLTMWDDQHAHRKCRVCSM